MSVRFRYGAATPDGQVVEGVVQAPSRQSVLEALRRQRLYPVAVDEATTAAGAPLGRRLGRRAAVTLWTRNAATLLGAGVPLDRTLAFTAQHAGHDGLADTVRQVRRAVQGGASLADALAQHPAHQGVVALALARGGRGLRHPERPRTSRNAPPLARGPAGVALDRRHRAQVLDGAVRPHAGPALEERRASAPRAQDRSGVGDEPRGAGKRGPRGGRAGGGERARPVARGHVAPACASDDRGGGRKRTARGAVPPRR